GVERWKYRIASVKPRRLPTPRLLGQEVFAPQRLHAARSRPEVTLIQAAPIHAHRTRAHHIVRAELRDSTELLLARGLGDAPGRCVEALEFPDGLRHRELREQHELGRVQRGVLAERRPFGAERIGFVRELANGDAHRAYQTRARARGSRYNRCPAATS